MMGVINQRDEMIQKQFSEAKKSQDDAESLKSDYKRSSRVQRLRQTR
ncbi:MAG: hypothetical protein ACLRI8_10455 [Agathobacter rectalis]